MKKPGRGKKKSPSIMAAVESGNVEAVRAAVAAGAGLLDEMEDASPLANAAEKNDAEMVEALLQLGHKPDLGGIVVPLALAARNGNQRLVELLLSRGANVNESGRNALDLASQWGKPEVARFLKQRLGSGAKLR